MFHAVLDGVLGDARLTDRHGILGLQRMAHELLRRRQHPGPVAGKGKGLAEGCDLHQMFAPAGFGEEVVGANAAGDEAVVGLVEHQGDVAPGGQLVEFTHGFRRDDRTGRIARGDQEDGPGSCGNQPGKGCRAGNPAGRCIEGGVDAADAQHFQSHRVVEIGRQLHDDLVACPAQGHHGEPEGLAGADRETDLPRVDAGAVEAAIPRADRLAHLGQPLVGAVA